MRDQCQKERVLVSTSGIICGKYRQSSDVTLGIFPPSDCMNSPLDYARLKNEFGFSLLGIYPDDWKAVQLSKQWSNSEILLSIQDIAYQLATDARNRTPGSRSSEFNKLYSQIKEILKSGRLYGVNLNEPNTRGDTANSWELWIDELLRLFKNNDPNYLGSGIQPQNIFINSFFQTSKDGNLVDNVAQIAPYSDGIINDNWENEKNYWKYLVETYSRALNNNMERIDLSVWINIAQAHLGYLDQAGRYQELFRNLSQVFKDSHAKTIWVYPLDVCVDLLQEISNHIKITKGDGGILDILEIIEEHNSDGSTTTHYVCDYQEELNRILSDSGTRISPVGSSKSSSALIQNILDPANNYLNLKTVLTSCLKQYKIVGMGGVCHCGAARKAMCNVYCHRLYEFLDAALENGILKRDCYRVRTTTSESWRCNRKPVGPWNPENPDQEFWTMESSTSKSESVPVNPVEDEEYRNHRIECDTDPIQPTGESFGMKTFKRGGFVFEIK